MSQFSMANDLVNHAYLMKPPRIPTRTGFEELLGWTHGDLGEWLGSSSPLSHIPCLMHLFYLAVPELYTFIINL